MSNSLSLLEALRDDAGAGPVEGVHFDQHGHRTDRSNRINGRANFEFDAFGNKVHRDHVDKKRLKGDVQIAGQRQYLVFRIAAQIDINISRRLQ